MCVCLFQQCASFLFQNSRIFTFDPQEEALRSVSTVTLSCSFLNDPHLVLLLCWWVFLHLLPPQKLCQSVLSVLGRQVQPGCQKTCLESLRILSRDKRVLAPVATREGMLTLGGLARLCAGEEGGDDQPSSQGDTSEEEERVVVEALKCLSNVILNSPAAQQVSVDVQLVNGLCATLRTARTWHHEVGLFTLRLLFLLSALRPDVRGVLRIERHAVKLLTEVLEHTLDVRWVGPYEAAPPDPQAPPIPAEDNERAMEALKALFNLTLCDAGEVSVSRLCIVKLWQCVMLQ